MERPLRISIIGAHYAPEPSGNAPYTTGIAEGLAVRGHEVTVHTSFPHYPTWELADGVPRRESEYRNGVRLERTRHYVPAEPTPLKRLVYELGVGAHASLQGFGRPDVVVCISPLMFASALTATRAKLSATRPAVGLVIQDIYSRGVAETGTASSHSTRAIKALESRLLRSVDGISVIHDRFKADVVTDLGVPEDRVTVIRNWTHVREPSPFDEIAFRRSLGWRDDETIVLHAGAMGVKQGLHNVVQAAQVADQREEAVRFVLLGDGGERRALEESAQGVKSLQFLRPMPDDEDFMRVHRVADILLVHERAGVAEMSVPSKLTTYFAAGKPILAATGPNGATAEEIRGAQAGVRVDPDKPTDLLQGVLALSADEALRTSLGTNGRRYASDALSRGTAIAAYDQWVCGLVEKRKRETHG